ncbi:MAG: hypothetical protein UHS52_05125, partial [Alistipes sp.]|nr:hypothetical protein [Alistipes sp.]
TQGLTKWQRLGMGSCGFLWVLVGSCGEGGEALQKNPHQNSSELIRTHSPSELIRTYQNPSHQNLSELIRTHP